MFCVAHAVVSSFQMRIQKIRWTKESEEKRRRVETYIKRKAQIENEKRWDLILVFCWTLDCMQASKQTSKIRIEVDHSCNLVFETVCVCVLN